MVAAAVTADRAGRGRHHWPVAVLVRCVAAVGAGLLLYVSFPPRTLWWLAPAAFAVLGAVIHGRRARAGLGYGYLFGLGFLLPLLVWTGSYVGSVPWLLLAAASAALCAPAVAGMAVVSTVPAAPLFGAALWVAAEALRARAPFDGFPWGRVAFGQPDGVYLPIGALGGAPLLSFAVVLTGLALAEALRRWRLAPRRRLIGPGVLAALPVCVGLASGGLVDATPEAGELTVALVQGNVPQAGLDFNAQRRAVLDNHRRRTEQLAADVRAGRVPQPDLVLWPENAADIDPLRNPDAAAAIDAAANAINAPILLGAILDPPNGPFNAVLQWEPGVGVTGQYIKRHVQPFGEYIPLRPLARLVSPEVERVSRPIQPGDRVGVLDVAGTRVAVATCYEIAFDYVATDAVRAGGTLLAVPTNNATFGFTEMTYQQLAMSQMRAVEHSRTVLVAATSGVSAVIDPDGTVAQRTGLFTSDALVARVPLRTTTTLATRLGSAPEWLLVTVGVGAMVPVLIGARRRPPT